MFTTWGDSNRKSNCIREKYKFKKIACFLFLHALLSYTVRKFEDIPEIRFFFFWYTNSINNKNNVSAASASNSSQLKCLGFGHSLWLLSCDWKHKQLNWHWVDSQGHQWTPQKAQENEHVVCSRLDFLYWTRTVAIHLSFKNLLSDLLKQTKGCCF